MIYNRYFSFIYYKRPFYKIIIDEHGFSEGGAVYVKTTPHIDRYPTFCELSHWKQVTYWSTTLAVATGVKKSPTYSQ